MILLRGSVSLKQRSEYVPQQRLKQQKRQTRPKNKNRRPVTEETDSEPDADEKESEEGIDTRAVEQVDQSTNKRQQCES